ncbi:MarR family transcriptional regulator [Oxalicibacterium flavum]|uniref:MarR family transcriptional regulator n=1 Tax=Oxalicibacterium flavum TaxID=179467 RepID=A0A8J2XWM0_9BURK|nr:MarR family transcriptional regulator [Oxalicibacterium flavum]GGB96789.1 MarR family transcriptional regulator [Oxalicibacterium flavum]
MNMIEEAALPYLSNELASVQARSLLFTRPGFLIRRLHQIHSALFMEETLEHNITPVQYSLLTALEEYGELDQNSLAHHIGLERTSVAEVLPRLEQRELIARRQSEQDKRVKYVKLSRKGRALVKKMRPAVQRAHDRTIEGLSEEERKLFILLMVRLVESEATDRVPLLKAR